MTLDQLEAEARTRHLTILGGFHPTDDDTLPVPCKTLLLLGPNEPAFWPAFTTSDEYQDDGPDPVDRWSTRVIGDWAKTLDAAALFPFGGEPFLPFFTWAIRTGRIHASPVNFLVHDQAGLFVSFRGALALDIYVDLAPAPPSPCTTCTAQPCRTACPVAALTPAGYDVAACKGYLDTPAGQDCLSSGCAVRRACPVSRTFGRLPEQSAYHMHHFNGGHR